METERRETEYRIYVGLNDAVTKEQRFDSEKYVSLLKRVCYSYHVPFSFALQEGGYFHEDGTYVQERSLVISLIGVGRDTVLEIARDLCAFFRQESVLVTAGEVLTCVVSESVGTGETP